MKSNLLKYQSELDEISSTFDLEIKNYLAHKLRGGNANQAGNNYENFFAVACISRLIKINSNNRGFIRIQAQCFGFVDDLLIEHQHNKEHFQLKNSKNVSWGTGLKSISEDFCMQKKLNDCRDIKSTKLNLVCSDNTNFNKLVSSMPHTIKNFSQVIFFPNVDSLSHLRRAFPDFNDNLTAICVNDSPDKLEALSIAILGLWVNCQDYELNEMVDKLKQLKFSFLKTTADGLDVEFIEILERIDRFRYSISNGFFCWDYHCNLEEGIIPYPIESSEFEAIQQRITTQNPSTFEELEEFLT